MNTKDKLLMQMNKKISTLSEELKREKSRRIRRRREDDKTIRFMRGRIMHLECQINLLLNASKADHSHLENRVKTLGDMIVRVWKSTVDPSKYDEIATL